MVNAKRVYAVIDFLKDLKRETCRTCPVRGFCLEHTEILSCKETMKCYIAESEDGENEESGHTTKG